MASGDQHRGLRGEAGGKSHDVELDVAVEAVDPVDAEGEPLAAAGGDLRVLRADRNAEVGFRRTDCQGVRETFAAETATVGHANEVRAILRGGEGQAGVAAELAFVVVIVGEVEREDRQAVFDNA